MGADGNALLLPLLLLSLFSDMGQEGASTVVLETRSLSETSVRMVRGVSLLTVSDNGCCMGEAKSSSDELSSELKADESGTDTGTCSSIEGDKVKIPAATCCRAASLLLSREDLAGFREGSGGGGGRLIVTSDPLAWITRGPTNEVLPVVVVVVASTADVVNVAVVIVGGDDIGVDVGVVADDDVAVVAAVTDVIVAR